MEALAASGKDTDLDQLLGNVKGMASSSGGSWFSSMPAFSKAFRAQFESKAGRDGYNTAGYNGQLRQIFAGLFDATGRPRLSQSAKDLVDLVETGLTAVRQTLATLGLPSDLTALRDTLRFVAAMADNVVSQSGLNLASPRNPWANDVDLVIGGVLQTSPMRHCPANFISLRSR